MSFFSEASLAMIPSGYKTSKVYSALPITGDGDLTFSRSNDTATRVGPDGLIEKVRTNLLLQSNSFDTTWARTEASLTSGQSGYDGTTNAWKLTPNGNNAGHYISQPIASSTLTTISVFAKPDGYNFIMIYAGGYGGRIFDISNGTIEANIGTAPLSSKIEAVANGFYRCSIVVSSTSDAEIFVADTSSNYVFTGDGTSGILIQASQLETGDIATDYIATTTAAVSVGPVANVPRLDYLGSSCPRLNLEPQRTNLLPMSEQITNATFWNSAGGDLTAAANVAVSPDGYTNADSITLANSSNRYYVSEPISLTAGTVYTYTVYMKSASGNLNIFMSGVNGLTGQMKTVTTEWQRFTLTFTMHANGAEYFGFDQRASGASTSGTVYFWGAQVEAGAYATSYIPTLGAAVTRGTDDAYKTGISSLIGQTAGTIYLEADIQKYNESGFYAAISAGLVLGTAIYLYQPSSGDLQVLIRNSGNPDASITINSANWTAGFNKVAIAYTATTAEVFINGVSKGTTSFVSAPACSQFTIGSRPDVLGTLVGTGTYNQALLFPTRLSNDSLAALTSL